MTEGGAAGQWGLYPWFAEHGEDLVHPDDREAFAALMPYGKVFRCDGEVDGYLRLAYGERDFRVRPGLFQRVEPPTYGFGAEVVVPKHGAAVVREINWHHKESEPLYFVEAAGNRLKKRYFTRDLAPA